MPPLDTGIVDNHKQLDDYSCIPSSVELVLKLLGIQNSDYYDVQIAWGKRRNGSFGDFNGREVGGLKWRHQFYDDRGPAFPLDRLFAAIDSELGAKKYVIVSLAAAGGWHMFVVYAKIGVDYLAVSKSGAHTIYTEQVRGVILAMQGTDIMTYE